MFPAPVQCGVLDTVLKKHLQLVSSYYKKNKEHILDFCGMIKKDQMNHNPLVAQVYRGQWSISHRNQGNAFFKSGDFINARLSYTKSLAEVIKGELAAMAYANRS